MICEHCQRPVTPKDIYGGKHCDNCGTVGGTVEASKCPSCKSPAPHLHPCVQFDGEVRVCRDDFHRRVTSENTPHKIALVADLLETMEAPSYWWLSFADDTGNLGCCIVQAVDFLHAVREAHARGCNPGGECEGIELPSDLPITKVEVAKWGLNRLITRKEMIADGQMVRVSDGQPLRE